LACPLRGGQAKVARSGRELGDRAGNRELHMDDYVVLVLVYLMNPMIDSMRILQKVSGLPEIQKRLGIKRFSLGSFSESCSVFEPERLQKVVEQLAGELHPIDRPELLKELPGKLTLVDGSLLDTLCTVARAMYLPKENGTHSHAFRLHLQLDVDHHVPGEWEITEPKNTGKSDEKNALRRTLDETRATANIRTDINTFAFQSYVFGGSAPALTDGMALPEANDPPTPGIVAMWLVISFRLAKWKYVSLLDW